MFEIIFNVIIIIDINFRFNMVRYDPTQEEHKKYIKDKPELPIQKRPKKQKLEKPKVTVEPIVNTDKYYKVDDNLKNIFSSQNEFSLTSLFHTSDESKFVRLFLGFDMSAQYHLSDTTLARHNQIIL